MGKSAIKSATKAVTVPTVVKPTKESAKKQKIALKQEVKKKKVDASSSDESSSESEEEQVKAPAKKTVTPAKPAVVESSSSDEESSEEESSEDDMPASKKAAAKPTKAAPKKDESSDSSDSDSSSEEEEKPAAKKAAAVAVKKATVAAPQKKVAADSSSESSDESESDSSDEETPAPKVAAPAPKVESDSSGSSSDSESDEEEAPKAKAASLKRSADAKSAEEPQKKKMKTETSASSLKPIAKKAESSSSEDDSEESSEEEPSKAQTVKKVSAPASKSDSDSEEESEEETPAKTPSKKDNDVEMVDAATPKINSKPVVKEFKSPATPATSGSKTLFAGNLPWSADQDTIIEFFKDCGEVVDVRFAYHDDGHAKGFGHVEFATAEGAQKALALNGASLSGRPIKLDLAHERGDKGAYTPNTGKREGNSFSKGGGAQTNKVFVRGFDNSFGEDETKNTLREHFGSCGEISYVSVPIDRETQSVKGIAYVEFSNADGFNKALELDGSDLGGGYYLNVQVAKPRVDAVGGGFDSSGGRPPRGGFSSGGPRGRGRESGGRFGGRDGGRGRGRGRGTPNRPSMATVGTGKKTVFED